MKANPETTNNEAYETPKTILHLLFSFKGRVSLNTFWNAAIAMGLINLSLFHLPLWDVVSAIHLQMFNVTRSVALYWILVLFVGIPTSYWISLALIVKRLHDRDRSGRWYLFTFVPIVGWIWGFIQLGCLKGTDGDNRFGKNPANKKTPYTFKTVNTN